METLPWINIREKRSVCWSWDSLSLSLFVYKTVGSGQADEISKFIIAFKSSDDDECLKAAMVEIYEAAGEYIEGWKQEIQLPLRRSRPQQPRARNLPLLQGSVRLHCEDIPSGISGGATVPRVDCPFFSHGCLLATPERQGAVRFVGLPKDKPSRSRGYTLRRCPEYWQYLAGLQEAPSRRRKVR